MTKRISPLASATRERLRQRVEAIQDAASISPSEVVAAEILDAFTTTEVDEDELEAIARVESP